MFTIYNLPQLYFFHPSFFNSLFIVVLLSNTVVRHLSSFSSCFDNVFGDCRTPYWELESHEGCLENVTSCKFYFSFCKPLPIMMIGSPACPDSGVCLEIPHETGNKSVFHGIGNYFVGDPFKQVGELSFSLAVYFSENQCMSSFDILPICLFFLLHDSCMTIINM